MKEHPITPLPELVQKLAGGPGTWLEKISKAYCAGADQELEAILQWLLLNGYAAAAGELDACRNRLRHEDRGGCSSTADWLYEARRPKPPRS